MSSSCLKWPSGALLAMEQRWALGMGYVVIGIVAAIGNAVVVAAMVHRRTSYSRSTFFLFNLCIADFVVGCVASPLGAYSLLHDRTDASDECTADWLLSFVTCFSCMASFLLLGAISFDRYIKIILFDRIAVLNRPAFMITTSIVVWLVSIGFGMWIVFEPSSVTFNIVLLAVTSCCFLATLMIYAKIFNFVEESRKAMMHHVRGQPCERMRKLSLRQQTRLAVTFFIIVLALFASWLPFFVAVAMRTDHQLRGERFQNITFFHWTFLLGFSNSAWNPIIYNIRNRQLRQQIAAMVTCGQRTRSTSFEKSIEPVRGRTNTQGDIGQAERIGSSIQS